MDSKINYKVIPIKELNLNDLKLEKYDVIYNNNNIENYDLEFIKRIQNDECVTHIFIPVRKIIDIERKNIPDKYSYLKPIKVFFNRIKNKFIL